MNQLKQICEKLKVSMRSLVAASVAIALLVVVSVVNPVAGVADSRANSSPQLSMPEAVATAGDFQEALNTASPGDVITLQAGVDFVGNFTLPHNNSDWVTIRSSASDALPPEGMRVTPADRDAMPRLVSPNSLPALRTEGAARNYRFIGVEFTISPDVMLNYGIVTLGGGDENDSLSLPGDLIIDRCYIHGHPTADVSRGIALNSARTDIINSYISDCHGIGFDTQAIAGWNGPGPFRIINNYLEAAGENVMFGGADPKITELVPSDIDIINNHCVKPVSWKEGILSKPQDVVAAGGFIPGNLIAHQTYYYRVSGRGRAGYSTMATSSASDEVAITLGADQTSANISWPAVDHASEYRVYRTTDDPAAPNRDWIAYTTLAPSFGDLGDIAGTQLGSTPPELGTRWSVKNLFELKNARRVKIEGNLFENNWVDAQSGFAIQLTVRNQDGTADWSVIEDVVFANNVVRHSNAGINLLGSDDLHPSQQVKRVVIKNNLFDELGGAQWGGGGRFLQITETVDAHVDHNTVFNTGNIITAYGKPNEGFVFTNNIVTHNEHGIIGDGSAVGKLTLDQYFPAYSLKKNVIIGGPGLRYPKKNFFPATIDDVGFTNRASGDFRLAENSAYKNAGTKGTDIGADIETIETAMKRALDGSP